MANDGLTNQIKKIGKEELLGALRPSAPLTSGKNSTASTALTRKTGPAALTPQEIGLANELWAILGAIYLEKWPRFAGESIETKKVWALELRKFGRPAMIRAVEIMNADQQNPWLPDLKRFVGYLEAARDEIGRKEESAGYLERMKKINDENEAFLAERKWIADFVESLPIEELNDLREEAIAEMMKSQAMPESWARRDYFKPMVYRKIYEKKKGERGKEKC